MNRLSTAIVLIILLVFPLAIARETSRGHNLFQPSIPPDPLLSDLMWIKENFENTTKIVMVRDYWPAGPKPAFVGWAIVFLDIDMRSSFIYIGQLYDLLVGKPSEPPYGFPTNQGIIKDCQTYDIFVLTYGPGSWMSFYDPDGLEMLMLEKLRPNVYKVKEVSALEVSQWCRLCESITTGQLPEGDIGYIESSFANWTAKFGHIAPLESWVEFTLWQNATEGWIEARGLEINYQSYPFILMRANTNGSLLNYIDFYNRQSKFMGRWKLGATTSDWTIFILDLRSLNLPVGEFIWRMVVVLSSVKESRSLLVEWIVFMNLTVPTSE